MNSQEYSKLALVTEPLEIDSVIARLSQRDTIRLLHASFGISSESGEVADAAKRFVFYGKPLDRINMIEEAGDLLWYINVLLNAVGSNFDETMDRNIAKLKARYGEKFTEEKALNRDLNKERAVLEGEIAK
jgi:NTP pyrophosphatase (non-canonical NTP hydrolase)